MSIHRIAQLSDLHILDPQRPSMGTRIVSFGRAIDAVGRVQKLKRAVIKARSAGADHFVLSGDLTELGTSSQFETLAEAMADARLGADEVTLVPGNHDLYNSANGWKDALAGPLSFWSRGAALAPGMAIDRGSMFLLPVDVTRYQSIACSAGEYRDDVATALERRVNDPALQRKPSLIIQHHPPFSHATSLLQWLDGLRNYARLLELLARNVHTFVMHGHLHKAVDKLLTPLCSNVRVWGAPAIVDDKDDARVRLFDVLPGGIVSRGFA